MSIDKKILSQLLDGELNARDTNHALEALLTHSELQQYWQTLHTARAVMRKDNVAMSADLVDKVSRLLEGEASIMAPNNILADQDLDVSTKARAIAQDNVITLKVKRSKVAGFMAVAASLALLAIFIYPTNPTQAPMLASNNKAALEGQAELELQSMMVQHGEFSGAAALNGLVAYAKVVNGPLSSSAQ